MLVNAALATCCNTILHSKEKNDLVTCKCGNIAIGGGNDYIKVVGANYSRIDGKYAPIIGKFYSPIKTLNELEEIQKTYLTK